MKTPEQFNLLFAENYFSPKEEISVNKLHCPWYLRILGFNLQWECKVLNLPEAVGDNVVGYSYQYEVRPIKGKLLWFKWIIKRY